MLFGNIIDRRDERAAAKEDENKQFFPAEIGASLAFPDLPPDADAAVLANAVQAAMLHPEKYYGPPDDHDAIQHAQFDGEWVSFASAHPSGIVPNDTVFARVFESKARRGTVILVPFWNAPADSLVLLAKILHWLGYSTAVLVLPYHHQRKRPGSLNADYFVSANLGRTIQSVRQAVSDVSGLVSWLKSRGHDGFAVIGASLGSCIAGIVGAFDPRVRASLLFLTAGSFGDVVWTGRSTRHIGAELAKIATLEQVRTIWSIISLYPYGRQFREGKKHLLILWANRDRVVLPIHTMPFLEQLREARVDLTVKEYPCGHYTMGFMPFNALATWHTIRFLGSLSR